MRIYLFSLFILYYIGPTQAQEMDRLRESASVSVDPGPSYIADTEIGKISVGLSDFESDQEHGTHSGNVEVGYVFEIGTDEIIPKTIYWTPFYINRFENSGAEKNYRAGEGVGWQLSWGEKGSSHRWIFRNSYIYNDRKFLDSHRDEEVTIEFVFGIEILFSSPVRSNRLPDLRKLPVRVEREIDISNLPPMDVHSYQARALRVSIMSTYFLDLITRYDHLEKFYKENSDRESEILKLDFVKVIEGLGRPAHLLKLDRMLWENNLSYSSMMEILKESLGEWLRGQLRYQMPLSLFIKSDETHYCMLEVLPGRRLENAASCGNGIFDENLIYEDFLAALTEAALDNFQEQKKTSAY